MDAGDATRRRDGFHDAGPRRSLAEDVDRDLQAEDEAEGVIDGADLAGVEASR